MPEELSSRVLSPLTAVLLPWRASCPVALISALPAWADSLPLHFTVRAPPLSSVTVVSPALRVSFLAQQSFASPLSQLSSRALPPSLSCSVAVLAPSSSRRTAPEGIVSVTDCFWSSSWSVQSMPRGVRTA